MASSRGGGGRERKAGEGVELSAQTESRAASELPGTGSRTTEKLLRRERRGGGVFEVD